MMSDAKIGTDDCAKCGQPGAKKRCTQCKKVYYCSVDCQRANWEEHRRCCVAPQLEKTEPPECWRRAPLARSLLWFPAAD